MRLFALLCTGLAGGARGQSWKIDSVQSDLRCELQARPLIVAGNQSQCNSSEIYNTMASVGTCRPCTDEPSGRGYYCENNRVLMCPPGHYCPSYLEKIECPEGKWCKAAFFEPMDCRAMIYCPKGSENQMAGLGFLFGMIVLLSCGCCCSCFIGYRERREEAMMKAAVQNMKDDDGGNLGKGLKQDTPPVEIEFENMCMKLKSNDKLVLNNVSGRFPTSSLVALMGPSGGGKTTFMNALCGRANYGTVTGEVKINGKKGGVQDIPKLVGFVPQDDIMHPDLTVTQVLHFNALLRLPASTTPDAITDHVNSVIKVLGLEKIAHNIVGDPDKRGISGGQKKRVNIGMELVAMPAVIFMDEPTSGLDGAATIQLANCLGGLQKDGGLTIVCVIHQPRWAVYNQFTHLLLLGAGGSMVYCGDAKKIEEYLTSINFRLPERENPADWMIDVVCGLVPQYESQAADAQVAENFTAPGDLFKIWDEKYRKKNAWLGDEEGGGDEKGNAIVEDRKTPGRLKQTWIFYKRCARQFDKTLFGSTCCILFFLGVVFGVLYQQMAEFSYSGMMGIISGGGFIFFMITTITARGLLGSERLQYMREFKSGTSSFSFWFAKVLWNLINVFMYAMSYSLPLYWIMPVPAQDFGDFFWMYLLAAWYHMGLGMLLSVMFTNATTSLLLSVFVPMLLELAFSGGMILIKDMDPLMRFLSSLSCGRWFKHDLYLAELDKYPDHVLQLQPVRNQLEDMDMSTDDNGIGSLSLIILGLALRLWMLIILVLLKYAEGNSCMGRILHLVMKCFGRIGLSIPSLSPKAGDTVDSHPVIHRQPSSHKVSSTTDMP